MEPPSWSSPRAAPAAFSASSHEPISTRFSRVSRDAARFFLESTEDPLRAQWRDQLFDSRRAAKRSTAHSLSAERASIARRMRGSAGGFRARMPLPLVRLISTSRRPSPCCASDPGRRQRGDRRIPALTSAASRGAHRRGTTSSFSSRDAAVDVAHGPRQVDGSEALPTGCR